MIYFNSQTRQFSTKEVLDTVRDVTGTQDLSKDDKERALYRLATGQTSTAVGKLPRQLKRDTKKGFLGIRRSFQGGKKGQYGNAAGRIATTASIALGRDKDTIPELAAKYNGTVRGAMALKQNLTRKDGAIKRLVNRITGKPDRTLLSNALNPDTYAGALREYNLGKQNGYKRANKQLKKISNNKLSIN